MTVYQGTSFTPILTAAGYALFRAGVKVSSGTVNDLAESLRRRHDRQGTRWRLLSPVAQAVLNVQTVCSPAGELLWAAAPAPGATVDVTAARKAGIAATLTSLIGVFADLGYLGWDKEVITGRRKPRGKELTAAQRAANRLQAQLRCVGERGNARLKYWKVLASELRCHPERCTAVVKAVLALHYMEHDPFAALRAA
jgi:hypothetical protein